ncbi:hypothetical protein K501DRAFT_287111 [Backusella circina FSU 941]|nr:hypothetical protein K501DRAFT_287111 [Backusella circina FSU 941]
MTFSFADRQQTSIYTYVFKFKKSQRELRKQKSQRHQRQEEGSQKHQAGTSSQKDYIYTPPTVIKHYSGDMTLIQEEGAFGDLQSTEQTTQDFECLNLVDSDTDNLRYNTSFLHTWNKLNGLETSECCNTAISISLSPIFLSAANLARQRRQLTR